MAINSKKFRNTVLLLITELNGQIEGKKKLAKLLYYIDFDSYERYEKPITGDTYYARDMGPLGASFKSELKKMAEKGDIKIKQVPNSDGYKPTEVYTSHTKPKINALNKREIEMIKRVARNYGGLSGTQLETLSHEEAPYIATDPHEIIDYELAFYRETEFDR